MLAVAEQIEVGPLSTLAELDAVGRLEDGGVVEVVEYKADRTLVVLSHPL
jgi:hypothetical protein